MSIRFVGRLLFVFALFVSGLVIAEPSCPALSCDCSSIPNEAWRTECQQFEKHALTVCSTDPKRYSHCRVAGLEASSLSLSVSALTGSNVTDPVAALEQSRLLSWSIREENSAAVSLQDRGEYAAALTKRKRENQLRRQLYKLSLGLAGYYELSGEFKQRDNLLSVLSERNHEDAQLAHSMALSLWQSIAEAGDASTVRVRSALAQRMLRNAGDEMELAAHSMQQIDELRDSVELWQDSARFTAQLLSWKREQGAKPEAIEFYRQRAAARWYQAALTALLDGDEDVALEAKRRSSVLWAASL